MAFQHHDEIAGTLDRVKDQGLISEYLVSWRGRGGDLEPKLVVWSAAGTTPDRVRSSLVRSLVGLVPSTRILIVADEASPPVQNPARALTFRVNTRPGMRADEQKTKRVL